MGTPVMTLRVPKKIFDKIPKPHGVYARDVLVEHMVKKGLISSDEAQAALSRMGKHDV